jgi:hypothetical protein
MRDDPFGLFCLYYLGLSPGGQYRFQNANQIAKRFNWTVADLMEVLRKQGQHPDVVLNTDFPMARHQADLQIAVEMESPDEVRVRARVIWEEFRGRVGKRRDWLAEIEREKEQERERKLEQRRSR